MGTVLRNVPKSPPHFLQKVEKRYRQQKEKAVLRNVPKSPPILFKK